jgi:YHS domain-containing protein
MCLEWTRRNRAVIIQLAAFTLITLMAGAAPAAEEKAGGAEQAVEDTYPLETCIVTGAELGSMGEPVAYRYEGREIRFCCKGCISRFEADPEAYLDKMDRAIIAIESPGYPLETCVVTGQLLGSMGDPVDYVYDNHLVRFCCAGCIKAFEEEPATYMSEVDEARAKRAAEAAPKPYPLDTCIVSGAALGSMGDPVVVVYEGQEVKLCCAGCLPRFETDPEKYMKKLKPAGDAPACATQEHKSCGGH